MKLQRIVEKNREKKAFPTSLSTLNVIKGKKDVNKRDKKTQGITDEIKGISMSW